MIFKTVSKKSFITVDQQLTLLRSHLLITRPEKPVLQNDEIIALLLKLATTENSILEKLKNSLKQ